MSQSATINLLQVEPKMKVLNDHDIINESQDDNQYKCDAMSWLNVKYI